MLRFGGFALDPASGELRTSDRVIELRPKTAELLELLVRAGPSRVVTREEIRWRLWPTTVVDYDTGINTCVRQLRDELGDVADSPRFIQTIPRRGYRFLVPVVVESADHAVSSAAKSAEPAVSYRVRVTRRGSGVVIAAALAITGLVGWRLAAADENPVVAVAAIETRGTVSEHRVAQRLVAEMTATIESAGAHGVRVTAWVPGMRHDSAGRQIDYRGAATDVGFLVSGVVFEESGSVEISIRLRDVTTGATWWSETYARSGMSLDSAAADVGRRAAAAVGLALLPSVSRPVPAARSRQGI